MNTVRTCSGVQRINTRIEFQCRRFFGCKAPGTGSLKLSCPLFFVFHEPMVSIET